MKDSLLAFIDTETTGLDPYKHEIIELALVVCKQISMPGRGPKIEVLKEYEWKIKPKDRFGTRRCTSYQWIQ